MDEDLVRSKAEAHARNTVWPRTIAIPTTRTGSRAVRPTASEAPAPTRAARCRVAVSTHGLSHAETVREASVTRESFSG